MSARLDDVVTRPGQPPPGRIVVLFRSGALPLDAPPAELLRSSGIAEAFATRFPSLRLSRVFNSGELSALRHLVALARERDGDYQPFDFTTAFYLDADWQDEPLSGLTHTLFDEVAGRLRSLPAVEQAYVDRPAPDPVISGPSGPSENVPLYLGPAPTGIDAFAAWQEGLDGAGQRLIDLERGWTFQHEGILAHGISHLSGPIDPTAQGHGTSVLGILCAQQGGPWPVGIAPNAGTVSTTSFGANLDRPHALFAALIELERGDTLLIEAQVYEVVDGQYVYCPIEVKELDFQLIRLGTAVGFVIVEAGGNGRESDGEGIDFDAFSDASGRQVLRRDVRDSRAILVTATDCTEQHCRLRFAPRGQRLDCFAWGEAISTLDSVNGATQGSRTDFGGTSGASAIIAGITLVVQQWVERTQGRRLDGIAMRRLLSERSINTRSSTDDGLVGVMPDLRAILSQGVT